MKNQEEYLEYYFDFADVRKSDLIQMINEIKKDAYNDALDDAYSLNQFDGFVDKESIMELKIK